MSALPPKADMCSALLDDRLGPKADSYSAAKKSLFDHLVGAGEQRRWNCKRKRLGGFEVDDQLHVRGPLNRPAPRRTRRLTEYRPRQLLAGQPGK
jgi:hypothetical protein